MSDKGVLDRANDFWSNSRILWLFKPFGCCGNRDDDNQLTTEKHNSLPKKIRNNTYYPLDDNLNYDNQQKQEYVDNESSLDYNSSTPYKKDDDDNASIAKADEYDNRNYYIQDNSMNQNIIYRQEQYNIGTTDQVQQQQQQQQQQQYPIYQSNLNNDRYIDQLSNLHDSDIDSYLETESQKSNVPSVDRKKIKKIVKKDIKINDKKKKNKVSRNPWHPNEDKILVEMVQKYGYSWSLISQMIRGRTGKQVRDRYLNKLNPSINKGKWTPEEDQMIIKLFLEKGPRWSEIAKSLNGRVESQVKNRFYSHIRKKFVPNQNNTQDLGPQVLLAQNVTPYHNMNMQPYNMGQLDFQKVQDAHMAANLAYRNGVMNGEQAYHNQDINSEMNYAQACDGFQANNLDNNIANASEYTTFNEDFGINHVLVSTDTPINTDAQQQSELPLLELYDTYTETDNITNNNNNSIPQDKISVPSKSSPNSKSKPKKNLIVAVGSPHYSSLTPDSKDIDSEIDSRLDKLAILFEKNITSMENLKTLDTMSIVRSSSNGSEPILPEDASPLKKIERIDVLAKRTKKLEYLLAKVSNQIQKISQVPNINEKPSLQA